MHMGGDRFGAGQIKHPNWGSERCLSDALLRLWSIFVRQIHSARLASGQNGIASTMCVLGAQLVK